jgi:integrase
LLAEVALDGLPKRAVVKATPLMSDFVDTYWEDLSRVWKASTTKRNGAALREQEAAYPAQVAIMRLLLFTGAQVGEILNLRWEWVQPPRLLLPDSKTRATTIWLNSQALKVLEGVERHEDTTFVFPNRSRTRPINLDLSGGSRSDGAAFCPMPASTTCVTPSPATPQ